MSDERTPVELDKAVAELDVKFGSVEVVTYGPFNHEPHYTTLLRDDVVERLQGLGAMRAEERFAKHGFGLVAVTPTGRRWYFATTTERPVAL